MWTDGTAAAAALLTYCMRLVSCADTDLFIVTGQQLLGFVQFNLFLYSYWFTVSEAVAAYLCLFNVSDSGNWFEACVSSFLVVLQLTEERYWKLIPAV